MFGSIHGNSMHKKFTVMYNNKKVYNFFYIYYLFPFKQVTPTIPMVGGGGGGRRLQKLAGGTERMGMRDGEKEGER